MFDLSPLLRRAVLNRDGGACTADGCDSRYRLETHHIVHRDEGGLTEEENLTTLCWYHHIVVIHRHGFIIDPESPAQRKRLIQPGRQHSPP